LRRDIVAVFEGFAIFAPVTSGMAQSLAAFLIGVGRFVSEGRVCVVTKTSSVPRSPTATVMNCDF
jgi:hypothetical protein